MNSLSQYKTGSKKLYKDDMANYVRVGTFIYRINPDNDKQLQRCSYGSSSWSRVAEFNGKK